MRLSLGVAAVVEDLQHVARRRVARKATQEQEGAELSHAGIVAQALARANGDINPGPISPSVLGALTERPPRRHR